jgi:hypothetical protein
MQPIKFEFDNLNATIKIISFSNVSEQIMEQNARQGTHHIEITSAYSVFKIRQEIVKTAV